MSAGLESAASSCLRHQWVTNRDKYGLANRIVRLGQIITDLSNWQRVKVRACTGGRRRLGWEGSYCDITLRKESGSSWKWQPLCVVVPLQNGIVGGVYSDAQAYLLPPPLLLCRTSTCFQASCFAERQES